MAGGRGLWSITCWAGATRKPSHVAPSVASTAQLRWETVCKHRMGQHVRTQTQERLSSPGERQASGSSRSVARPGDSTLPIDSTTACCAGSSGTGAPHQGNTGGAAVSKKHNHLTGGPALDSHRRPQAVAGADGNSGVVHLSGLALKQPAGCRTAGDVCGGNRSEIDGPRHTLSGDLVHAFETNQDSKQPRG